MCLCPEGYVQIGTGDQCRGKVIFEVLKLYRERIKILRVLFEIRCDIGKFLLF